MKEMLKMNQYEEFHDFDDEEDEIQITEYSKDESVTIIKKKSNKIKIVKEQVKELITFKKLKISNLIKIMRNRKRFNIQKMMNFMINLLMSQLLSENQQLRKKFV